MIENLFRQLPTTSQVTPRAAEITDTLLAGPSIRIERIVSCGQSSPPGFWYDQYQHEWVVLLTGAARLEFENHQVDLAPGDFVHIPAGCRHRVGWTAPHEPTIWLAIFYE